MGLSQRRYTIFAEISLQFGISISELRRAVTLPSFCLSSSFIEHLSMEPYRKADKDLLVA